MRKLVVGAALLLASASVMAQDEPMNPIADVCGDQPVVCIVAAVPLSLVAGAAVLYAVGEAWEMACGQPLLPPGDPENTANNDWQYQCPIATVQPVPSDS